MEKVFTSLVCFFAITLASFAAYIDTTNVVPLGNVTVSGTLTGGDGFVVLTGAPPRSVRQSYISNFVENISLLITNPLATIAYVDSGGVTTTNYIVAISNILGMSITTNVWGVTNYVGATSNSLRSSLLALPPNLTAGSNIALVVSGSNVTIHGTGGTISNTLDVLSVTTVWLTNTLNVSNKITFNQSQISLLDDDLVITDSGTDREVLRVNEGILELGKWGGVFVLNDLVMTNGTIIYGNGLGISNIVVGNIVNLTNVSATTHVDNNRDAGVTTLWGGHRVNVFSLDQTDDSGIAIWFSDDSVPYWQIWAESPSDALSFRNVNSNYVFAVSQEGSIIANSNVVSTLGIFYGNGSGLTNVSGITGTGSTNLVDVGKVLQVTNAVTSSAANLAVSGHILGLSNIVANGVFQGNGSGITNMALTGSNYLEQITVETMSGNSISLISTGASDGVLIVDGTAWITTNVVGTLIVTQVMVFGGVTNTTWPTTTAGVSTELDMGLMGQSDIGWPLSIPTYDGLTAVTHPNVVVTSTNWNGAKWWMVFSPYPYTNRENPSIVCSTNGINWTVPGGLTNPIALPVLGWNADPELVMLTNSALACFWINNAYTVDSYGTNVLMRSISTNGVVWSTPAVVMAKITATTNLFDLVSPTISVEADGTLRMWCWNMESNTAHAYASSDMGSNWTFRSACSNQTGSAFTAWHFDVVRVGSNYHSAYRKTQNYDCGIGYAWSADGYLWNTQDGVIPAITNSYANGFYMSSLVPRAEYPPTFDIYAGTWYPSVDPNSVGWRIVLIRDIRFASGNESFIASSVIAPTISATDFLYASNHFVLEEFRFYSHNGNLQIIDGKHHPSQGEVISATNGVLQLGRHAGTVSLGDLSIASGKFIYGDGSGLTNISGTNITGSITTTQIVSTGSAGSGQLIVDGNAFITTNEIGNLTVTNLATVKTLAFTTNALAAAGGTDYALDMNVGYKLLVAGGNITITNLVNTAVNLMKSTTLLIDDGGAERTLILPSAWYTADGAHVYYVSNAANYGILTVTSYGNVVTNAVFKLFAQ
jgi:hypothetical protein